MEKVEEVKDNEEERQAQLHQICDKYNIKIDYKKLEEEKKKLSNRGAEGNLFYKFKSRKLFDSSYNHSVLKDLKQKHEFEQRLQA